MSNTTITQKVIRETVEKPVYRDCVHDAASLRDINAALSVSADPGELPPLTPLDDPSFGATTRKLVGLPGSITAVEPLLA